MAKSVDMALQPLNPFIADWMEWDVELRPVLTNLYDWVRKCASTRGMRILTIDLPEIGKCFDKALSSGLFKWESVPTFVGNRGRNPLSQLLLRSFNNKGCTLEDNPDRIFFMRTLFFMWKKWPGEVTKEIKNETILKFIKTDKELEDPVLDWSSNKSFGLIPRDYILSRFRNNLRVLPRKLFDITDDVFRRTSGSFPEPDGLLSPRHGPGAVAEGSRFRDKFLFTHWSRKLDEVFPHDAYVTHDFEPRDLDQTLQSARLVGVPKTMKGERLISIEPLSNQYCQQAVLAYLRDSAPKWITNCYAFNSQKPSQTACREGSISGELATIDLSEASDRLSLALVELFSSCNSSLMNLLHSTRTHTIEIAEHGTFALKKYAGMGNATTFPVQSMIYSCLCISAILYEKGWKVTNRNIIRASKLVRVFGDDIILPRYAVYSLWYLLYEFGFKVNETKSHYEGHFREACGLDAYNGSDVTPFYLHGSLDHSTPEGIASWVEVSNNAYKKGLWKTSNWMIDQVPRKYRSKIPITQSDAFSLSFYSFQDDCPMTNRSRFNEDLQRYEIKCLTLKTSARKVERSTDGSLLQYFVEVPVKVDLNINRLPDYDIWKAGWTKRVSCHLATEWV